MASPLPLQPHPLVGSDSLSRLTGASSPRILRTDRFGFIIPDSSRTLSEGRQSKLPDTPSTATAAGAGAPPFSADMEDTPKPHEGPPPSAFIGLIARHSESDVALTEKERKERRAKMMLENLRIKKWTDMFSKWDVFSKKNRAKLKSRCRKGIPDALRGRAWMMLSDSYRRKGLNKGLYQSLLRRPVAAGNDVVEVIERDIHRTFPLHAMFTEAGGIGQTSLLRVLRAYAQYDQRVGYCQGMGFIAAMFLSYLPEEDAFFLLLSVMNFPPLSLTGLFSPGLPKVRVLEHQLEGLMKTKLPKLLAHFKAMDVHPTMYSAQWFMTLFTYNFPFSVVVRIWDCVLAEGWKVIFRVALALLKTSEDALMANSFEGIMTHFRLLPSLVSADELLTTAFSMRLRHAELDQLEDEFKSLIAPSPVFGRG